MIKPIRILYSPLSGRIYATTHYKIENDSVIVVTGKKTDVTDDIGFIIQKYGITFNEIKKKKKEKRNDKKNSEIPHRSNDGQRNVIS